MCVILLIIHYGLEVVESCRFRGKVHSKDTDPVCGDRVGNGRLGQPEEPAPLGDNREDAGPVVGRATAHRHLR